MNKKFTKLMAALALLVFMAPSMVGWGQTRSTVTDELTQSWTGVTGTTYTSWSGKTSNSDAVWAGQSAGGNSSIQLRSNNNNSGIITTTSGGTVTSVSVTWNTNTSDGRTLNIYGKNSAYSAPTDLYNSSNQGTLLGTIVKGTSTSLTISESYEYIGMRSASGAMYLTEIDVTWETGGGQTPTCVTPTFSPAAGTYTSAQSVTLSCTTDDATIYYTTDGSAPTTSSSVYSSAISVSSTTTIKAMAVAEGYENSSVATATYTIVNIAHAGTEADPYTVADARTAIDAGTGTQGVYATGIVSEIVTAWGYNNYQNITFNMVDEAGDEVFLQAFRCVGDDAENVAVGDIIVVYGNLTKYNTTYEFGQGCQVVSLTHPVITNPYIEADDVDITYDATSGEISYTLNNPAAEGSLSVTENVDWISNATLNTTTSKVTFDCVANSNAASRSGVVTITYTYGTNSTSKEVTVTQAGNPNVFNNISDITEVGTSYSVRGTVVAINSRGFVMGDGTGYVYYYKNGTVSQSVGAMVTMSGTTGTYGQIIQFTNSASVGEATSSNYTANTPAATVITAVPDYSTGYHLSTYFEFEGELTKSNSNYFITLGEEQIQISYPTTEQGNAMTALNGKNVHVKGYFAGINSNSKFTVMLESVEEVVSTTPIINADDINIAYDATSGEIAYTITNPDGTSTLGATTTADWISNITVASDKVTFTTTTNTGSEDRTATFTLTYSGATAKTVTVTQGHYVQDYAELPFEWDGTSTPTGITNSGVGTYSSAPYLKFDTQGDYIILKINETPGTLTFDIKGNTLSGSYKFTVLESANGTDYTTLKEYTSIGSSVANESLNPASTTRYIKWEYTTKSSGNVALGNIALAEYVDPATVPSITLASTTVNVDADGVNDGSIAITYQNLDITENTDFDIQFYDANNQELDKQDQPTWLEVSVQVADPEGYEVSYSVDANDSDARTAYFKVYALDNNLDAVYSELVTVSQAAAPVPTIELAPATLNVAAAGVNHCSNTITLTNMTVSEAKNFMLVFCSQTGGDLAEDPDWLADEPEFDGPDAEGKYSVIYNIAANTGTTSRTAYFKVYATPAAGKDGEIYSNIVTVTQAAPVAGEDTWVLTALADLTTSDVFVIVGDNGDNTYAMSNDNGTSSAPAAVEVIVSGNNLSGTIADNIKWNISGNADDGYTFYPNGDNENWLYCNTTASSSSNNNMRVGTGNRKAFEMSENTLVTKDTYTNRYVSVYSGTDWRGYTSTSTAPTTITFYKKVTASALTKEIKGYGGGESDSYYLIASPVASITPSAENGFLTTSDSDYDLYSFDQAQELEWCNFKNQTTGGWNLASEKGYLYASKYGTTLVFTGDAYEGTGEIDLTAGWNLIGNPYATAATLNKAFYRMNEDGDNFVSATAGVVYAMEGVFVHATTNATATFTAQSKGGKQSIAKVEINVSGSRGTVIDNAIVRFDKGETLEKFMLNPSHTRLYFTEGSKDYAIVRSNGQGEMPVNFKASQNGTYTITVEAKDVEMNYLHLVDNLTGANVDLLATPSYTFEAKTTDYASRFRLVFNANEENGASTGSETFAFFNGNEWMISNTGNATLQVIDVLGRVLSSETISGTVTVSLKETSGVYMLRLVNGNDVKVQKVVVR